MTSAKWGPPPWSWPGLTALVLALSLGVGWASTLILAALPVTPAITDKGLELLNGIGQVLAGAVATFIGASISTQRDPRPETAVAGAAGTAPAPATQTPVDPRSGDSGPPEGSDSVDQAGGAHSETHQ